MVAERCCLPGRLSTAQDDVEEADSREPRRKRKMMRPKEKERKVEVEPCEGYCGSPARR